MMRTIYVNYNDEQHKAVLNLNAIRSFSRLKGYKTINQFADSFSEVDQENMSFETLDNFALLFLCAFQEGARMEKQACKLTIEDVFLIFEAQKEEMMSVLTDSLGTDTEAENPQTPGATNPGQ